MDEHEDITEQLETENQMLWVHIINNIANRAKKIINSEIIHTIIWLMKASGLILLAFISSIYIIFYFWYGLLT